MTNEFLKIEKHQSFVNGMMVGTIVTAENFCTDYINRKLLIFQ